jgi:serine/threonine protein kinase
MGGNATRVEGVKYVFHENGLVEVDDVNPRSNKRVKRKFGGHSHWIHVSEIAGCIWFDGQGFRVWRIKKFAPQEQLFRVVVGRGIRALGPNCFPASPHGGVLEISFEANSKLEEIGREAFLGGCLESITIPNNVKMIDDRAFCGCDALKQVKFDSRSELEEIGSEAFMDTALKRVHFPENLKRIGARCFAECEWLTEVVFNGFVVIGESAFAETPVNLVAIPVGIRLDYAFRSSCRVIHHTIATRQVHLGIARMLLPDKRTQLVVPASLTQPAPVKRNDSILDLSLPPKLPVVTQSFGPIRWADFVKEYQEAGDVTPRMKLYRHRLSGQEIGVRIFPGSKFHTKMQERFFSEVVKVGELDHPCVLHVMGYSLRREGPPRMITEYLPGGSLKDMLLHPLSWWTPSRKAATIAGIVAGMAYIHAQQIFHRELKPDNIFFDAKNRVKVGYFGCSYLFEMDDWKTTAPIFNAPEMSHGYCDEKSDVYSFGLMMYEIITGENLFSGPGRKEMLFTALRHGDRPEIPRGVLLFSKELITACWARRRINRPSFEEIWGMLNREKFKVMPGVDSDEVNDFIIWLDIRKREAKRD